MFAIQLFFSWTLSEILILCQKLAICLSIEREIAAQLAPWIMAIWLCYPVARRIQSAGQFLYVGYVYNDSDRYPW